MKFTLIASSAILLASVALPGCGSAQDTTTEGQPAAQSDQDLSATAADALRKPSTTAASAVPVCPAGEKICVVTNAKGICVDRCVIDTALCVHPTCRVCDPDTAAPNDACKWDTEECRWDCPICDPVGTAPRPGCEWSTTACDWECPVCDPPPPPEKGCSWDPKACVWLCL